jgi:hypothetical protein
MATPGVVEPINVPVDCDFYLPPSESFLPPHSWTPALTSLAERNILNSVRCAAVGRLAWRFGREI